MKNRKSVTRIELECPVSIPLGRVLQAYNVYKINLDPDPHVRTQEQLDFEVWFFIFQTCMNDHWWYGVEYMIRKRYPEFYQ